MGHSDKREVTAGEWFRTRAKDGRAVLRYRPEPDGVGEPEPQLWLCRVGKVLVACDDGLGEVYQHDDNPGYLEEVAETASIVDVEQRWRTYLRMLKQMRRGFQRTSRYVA